MKRYSFIASYMHDNSDGRWVLYSEVQCILKENQEILELLYEIASDEFDPNNKNWFARVQEITKNKRGDYAGVQGEPFGIVSQDAGK